MKSTCACWAAQTAAERGSIRKPAPSRWARGTAILPIVRSARCLRRAALSISDAVNFFSELEFDDTRRKIAAEVLKEVRGRLGFLVNVGLEYLSLDRTAPTLSGGESQRIRLAGQIGCGLVGVLYILDEPSIGLHPRDNDRLLDTLTHLRDMGNTVVVVEHDEDTMRAADHIIDFGPGPGVRGGEVVATGTAAAISRERRSLTGQYLAGKLRIEVPEQTRPIGDKCLRIIGARHNNLKNIDVEIPLGALVCVTGVSGSGKSSLVNDILVEALRRDLNGGLGEPGQHDRIEGLEHLDKLIAIDQSPIGRTPRSNPSTYIKLFDEIRDLYTQLPDSKARGYKAGRFSFNVSGGRCEACEGNGSNRLEMDFLADIWVTCPVCEGHRFNRETLQVRFKGKSIADVLEMDVQQALEHFENIPKIRHKLQTLHDVGLDYLKLGQPSPTLSGGEAQRIKLARELVKKSTGRTLYLLDEPTTGLHFADIKMLLKVLHDFVDAGNTVVVVEHNLDVIKTADWVIDLGPEGGAGGGRLLAAGSPALIAADQASHTGRSLRALLDGSASDRAIERTCTKTRTPHPTTKAIRVQGARQHNLKGIDVEIPRDKMTVCCGMSGSGKSSLAMDTIYAEGQRRYVESLSSYARQFVGQMHKPLLDHIEGLSPAIAIEQKQMGHTPRSTVGTVTEIYDYLRILMARLGQPHCPDCDIPIGTQTADEIVDKILAEPAGTKLYLMAPLEINVGEKYEALWEEIRASGYVRMRVDGSTHSVDQPPQIDRRRKHLVEVVIDRIAVRADVRSRVADSVENALSLGKGVLHVAYPADDVPEPKWRVAIHSQHFACDRCGRSFEPLTPHSFSFNSSLGWCPACEGLGTQIGADPAALLRDPKLTLRGGAVALWPSAGTPLFDLMLDALARQTGVPLDVPFDQLSVKQRRVVMHGLDDDWIEVLPVGGRKKTERPLFRFQYKGLYPALEEAARLSPALRAKWEHLVDLVDCAVCGGSRLRDDASAVRLKDRTIDDLCRQPLGELLALVAGWKLDPRERKIAGELVREVQNRLRFLVDVGLEYLTLARGAPTLSGGEAQRIRLASQVGSGLCGVLYVLDEPTIGLHPRDNGRLLERAGKTARLGQHPAGGRARSRRAGRRRSIARFWPRGRRRRRANRGPRNSGRGGQTATFGHRAVSLRQEGDCRADQSADAVRPGHNSAPGRGEKAKQEINRRRLARANRRSARRWLVGDRRRAAQQPAQRHGPDSARLFDRRDGRERQRQELADRGRALQLVGPHAAPGPHHAGGARRDPRHRTHQQGDPRRPAIARIHAHLEPGNLYGRVRPDPRLCMLNCPSRGCGVTRRGGSVSTCPAGAARPARGTGNCCIEMHFLPDVWVECDTCRGRRYNPETLAVALSRAIDRRRARSVLRPGGQVVREHSQGPPHPANAVRRWTGLLDLGAGGADALGRRSPTRQAGGRTVPPRHRANAVSARRADHRLALRGYRQAARRAQPPGRAGQQRRRDRTQSRRGQDGRLGH